MSEFTLEELIISRMSKNFEGEIVAIGATPHADIAARLAKATHAPELVLVAGTSMAGWDCDLHPKVLNDEFVTADSALVPIDWMEQFHIIASGRFHIWLGPVQVDRSGSSNISVVGPWSQPKLQLIGARGIPDDLWCIPRFDFHVRRHTPRSLVNTVDFVCGLGYGTRRDELRLKTGAPHSLVTDLGVFTWDSDGEPQIESLHPGVGLETVRKQTGWDWNIDDDVAIPTTASPTAEELLLIRELLDPLGVRYLDSPTDNSDPWQTLVDQERKYFAVGGDGPTGHSQGSPGDSRD